jgi:superoxide dismutase, Fe-Mn family
MNFDVMKSSLPRRSLLMQAGAVAAATSFVTTVLAQDPGKAKPRPGGESEKKGQGDAPGFTLPKLPYAYDALEPAIDAETMKIHHSKHHQAYINNLNSALASHADLRSKTLEDLLKNLDQVPEDIRKAVRNNGGGHYNHSMFWKTMGKGKGGEPTGKLAQAIADAFGGFAAFKEQFSQAGVKQFGSGWAWLSVGSSGKLELEGLPNQDNPLMAGKKPILGLDVWEHAYYLKYRNVRPEYIAAWWSVVNWDEVAKNYAAAKA